jgi:hypothetical protein
MMLQTCGEGARLWIERMNLEKIRPALKQGSDDRVHYLIFFSLRIEKDRKRLANQSFRYLFTNGSFYFQYVTCSGCFINVPIMGYHSLREGFQNNRNIEGCAYTLSGLLNTFQ